MMDLGSLPMPGVHPGRAEAFSQGAGEMAQHARRDEGGAGEGTGEEAVADSAVEDAAAVVP
jgi:hypothetical protein